MTFISEIIKSRPKLGIKKMRNGKNLLGVKHLGRIWALSLLFVYPQVGASHTFQLGVCQSVPVPSIYRTVRAYYGKNLAKLFQDDLLAPMLMAASDSGDIDARGMIALWFLDQNENQENARILAKVSSEEGSGWGDLALAKYYLKKGLTSEVVPFLQRAIHRKNAPAAVALANLYEENKEPMTKVQAALRQAYELGALEVLPKWIAFELSQNKKGAIRAVQKETTILLASNLNNITPGYTGFTLAALRELSQTKFVNLPRASKVVRLFDYKLQELEVVYAKKDWGRAAVLAPEAEVLAEDIFLEFLGKFFIRSVPPDSGRSLSQI